MPSQVSIAGSAEVTPPVWAISYHFGVLTGGPFGVIDHQGDRYKLVRGLVDEPANSAAVAFYVNKAGDAVYLEPAGSRARIKAGG